MNCSEIVRILINSEISSSKESYIVFSTTINNLWHCWVVLCKKWSMTSLISTSCSKLRGNLVISMRWKSVNFLRKKEFKPIQKAGIRAFQGKKSALGIKAKQLLFFKFMNQDLWSTPWQAFASFLLEKLSENINKNNSIIFSKNKHQ